MKQLQEEIKTLKTVIDIIKNQYVACPRCDELYKFGTGHGVIGILDGIPTQRISMYICPKCYKKMTSVESVSVSYEVVGNEDKI